MKRSIISLAVLLTIAFWTTQWLSAHEKYRIVGTVTKFEKSQLEVKTKEAKIIKIALDDLTIVRRDKDKVSTKDLKNGQSVVVDALGDSLNDLVAVEIRIVPAITTTPGKK